MKNEKSGVSPETEAIRTDELPTFSFLNNLASKNAKENGQLYWEGDINFNGKKLKASLTPEANRNEFRNTLRISLGNNDGQVETWAITEYCDALNLCLERSQSNTLLYPNAKSNEFYNSLGFRDAGIAYKEIKKHPMEIFMEDIDLEKSTIDNHNRFNNISEVVDSLTKLTTAIRIAATTKKQNNFLHRSPRNLKYL